MSAPSAASSLPVAVFLSPEPARRDAFRHGCGGRFLRLFVAESAEQAAELMERESVDLLVLELEGYDRGLNLAALGQLVVSASGHNTAVVAVCPFTHASWIPALNRYGPVDYAIAPLLDEAMCDVAAEHLQRGGSAATPASLRALLAVRTRMQDAIADIDDLARMPARVCATLASFPGVAHAALFEMKASDDLQLVGQAGKDGLDMERLLGPAAERARSQWRHAFPGLVAALSGELCLLDAPEKTGEPELAMNLLTQDIHMVLGIPVRLSGGAERGSICLMFEEQHWFSPEDFATLAALAQLAGFALRTAEMARDTEQLAAQVTRLATTDALTGVANRRRGEELLMHEARRARRYQAPLALIAFDIDRFRQVNDRYGHAVGDLALRTVAAVVGGVLRSSDQLVRTGGETFAVIAPHTSAIDGLKVAEKIRAAVAGTDFAGCDRLTISAGVGQLTGDEDPDKLTLRVDSALARAKRAGRNCVELAMS